MFQINSVTEGIEFFVILLIFAERVIASCCGCAVGGKWVVVVKFIISVGSKGIVARSRGRKWIRLVRWNILSAWNGRLLQTRGTLMLLMRNCRRMTKVRIVPLTEISCTNLICLCWPPMILLKIPLFAEVLRQVRFAHPQRQISAATSTWPPIVPILALEFCRLPSACKNTKNYSTARCNPLQSYLISYLVIAGFSRKRPF